MPARGGVRLEVHDMSVREQCECGHDKSTHHRRDTMRPPRDGGLLDELVTVYGACLGAFCDCARFRERERKS